ncbi:MAG: ATP-binding protein [Bacteroidetes bacterium]|nr:MAG: ATP-binding protein [Bacteroidota bacterium]
MAHQSFFNWSGGKDSALALFHSLGDPNYEIKKLLTNVNAAFDRISMHGVRVSLLEKQSEQLGIPLQKILLPEEPSMEEYEKMMEVNLKLLIEEKYSHAFFGDIFLEDLRKYREQKLEKIGLNAVFPIWKRDTTELIKEFLGLGFKTIIVCVKSDLLDESFSGRVIDESFLNDLPKGVDPCGENGEFHSFVFDGPIFKEPIKFTVGEKIYKEYKAPDKEKESMGFWFCDLLPEFSD